MKRKMVRLFLIGTLFGVMITAAVTYVFAIPANSDYWRMEICNRGGELGPSTKMAVSAGSGWLIQFPDTPSPTSECDTSSDVKVHTERL